MSRRRRSSPYLIWDRSGAASGTCFKVLRAPAAFPAPLHLSSLSTSYRHAFVRIFRPSDSLRLFHAPGGLEILGSSRVSFSLVPGRRSACREVVRGTRPHRLDKVQVIAAHVAQVATCATCAALNVLTLRKGFL